MKRFKAILFFSALSLSLNSMASSDENDSSKTTVKKRGSVYRVDFPVGDLNTDINYPRKEEGLPDNTEISERKALSPAVPN